MSGRIATRGTLKFEVWGKSLRLIDPKISPVFCSYNSLEDDDALKKAIDDFIAIMNLGIDIHHSKRF